jgi:hypothetical protein
MFLGLINHPTVAHHHVDAKTEMMDVPGEFTDTLQRRTGCCVTAKMPRSKDFRCPQLLRVFLGRFAFRPCARHYIHIVVRNERGQARPQR